MPQNEEIERFFAAYPDHLRPWVEHSEEYQLAIKRGKITAAIEIASVIVTSTGDYYKMKRDIGRIMEKEFPELSN
jgi:hypothetical protein